MDVAGMTTVKLRAYIDFEAEFGEGYDSYDHISFYYNEGTWCADSLIKEMQKYIAKHGCSCDMIGRVDVLQIGDMTVGITPPSTPAPRS